MDPEHGPLAPSTQPLAPGQSRVSPAAFRHAQNQAIAKAVTDDLDNLARKYPNPPAPYPRTATPNSPQTPASSQSTPTPTSPRPSYPVPTFPPIDFSKLRLPHEKPHPQTDSEAPHQPGAPCPDSRTWVPPQPKPQNEPQSESQTEAEAQALHQAQAEAGATSLARLLAIHPPPNP